MAGEGWRRKFEDPIPLPNGKKLVTLRDAADYITASMAAPRFAQRYMIPQARQPV